MASMTIELTTNDWEYIDYTLTKDDGGFSFWCDNNVLFSSKGSPALDEQIPIRANTRFVFQKPNGFWIKGNIGNKIFLAPFDI